MKYKHTFVINRKKWRAGDYGKHAIGKGETELLNVDGYMCCLGQMEKQLGAKKDLLLNLFEPYEITSNEESMCNILSEVPGQNSKLSSKAMTINDNERITNEEREARLIKLFAKHGVKLEFVGEYTKYWS